MAIVPPIVINESNGAFVGGDLDFFDTEADALSSVEWQDIENKEFFAFDALGHSLKLRTDRSSNWFEETGQFNRKSLLNMLREYETRLPNERGRNWLYEWTQKIEKAAA